MAALIDGSVAVHAAADRQRMTILGQLVARDQTGSGPRAEAVVAWDLGARELYHS